MIIILILILSIHSRVFATDEIIASELDTLDLSSFIKEGEKFSKDTFEDLDVKKLLSSAIQGRIDNKKIYKNILKIFGEEVLNSAKLLATVLVIILTHSVLKGITESLGNESTSKVAYFVQYILIVSLVMSNFSNIIAIVEKSITNMVSFLNILVPLLISLIISTGAMVSAGILQPLLLFAIVLIGNTINIIIIPIIVISIVMGIISNISDKVQISKISKFMQSTTLWFLGIITTVFVSALSLEGTLGGSVDGVTLKGIKAATSGLIPVVGKTLGDSISTVLGCTNVIKNALGVVGIIVIIGICAFPIIKLTVLTLLYSFTAAIAQPIADKGIVKVLEEVARRIQNDTWDNVFYSNSFYNRNCNYIKNMIILVYMKQEFIY